MEEIDFHGAMTDNGIPSRYLEVRGGSLHVQNPDCNGDLIFSGGFHLVRLAVHIRPDRVAPIMVAS